jgi:uncharacterized protein YyaL (SSP411 family)
MLPQRIENTGIRNSERMEMSNRLINETSPYLLQHSDNPVDWFPWGDEAFERAKSEDKPIFLSVGYAACHWCHVMAHESFEDLQTAEFMNKHFINIKVDREERPDVDSIYMEAVVAHNGQGGWPLSVFLTPTGQPFFGGTYFPPHRRFNMPSFREVLESIQEEWTSNREGVERISAELTQRVQSKPTFEPARHDLELAALDSATDQLFKGFDWKFGGWGSAPKFPQASTIEFLLQRYQKNKDSLALDMAKQTLSSMAQGGLFDQIGGGFHRYSVDEKWLVPHFEKMLYDNATLLAVYLHAWQLTGEPDYLEIVDKTLEFLLREMRNQYGGFFASLDADSEGEEGKFYVWTSNEVHAALRDPADYELARKIYGLNEGPNFEDTNILFRIGSTREIADELGLEPETLRSRLKKIDKGLLDARKNRARPAMDDKVITAWNGLLLVSIAEIARVLEKDRYLQAAQELAHFLVTNLKTEVGWNRTWRLGTAKNRANLRDLAAVGLGLLALYETDFNPDWYREVEEIADEMLSSYQDQDGGFYDTHIDQSCLIKRPKSIQDTAIPSGNSLAITLLLRLYSLSGDSRYADPAWQALQAMQSIANRHPTAFSGWLIALDYAIGPQLQLALLGDPQRAEFKRFLEVVDRRYLPILTRAGGKPDSSPIPKLLENRSMIDEMVTAYLCEGFVCYKPTNSVEEFTKQLNQVLES